MGDQRRSRHLGRHRSGRPGVKRGEIYLVNFDPSIGSEVNKARPAILVSTDTSNATVDRLGRGVLTVVPVTSNTDRIFSFQVYLEATPTTGLAKDSKAQAEQVRALDVRRLIHRMGSVDAVDMARLNAALRTHLEL